MGPLIPQGETMLSGYYKKLNFLNVTNGPITLLVSKYSIHLDGVYFTIEVYLSLV